MKKAIASFKIWVLALSMVVSHYIFGKESDSVIFHTYNKKKLTEFLKNNPVNPDQVVSEKDQVKLWVVRSEELTRAKIKRVYPRVKKIYSKIRWKKKDGKYYIIFARYTSKPKAHQVLAKIKALTSNLKWDISHTFVTASVYKVLQSPPEEAASDSFTFGTPTKIESEEEVAKSPEILEKNWYVKTTTEAMKLFNVKQGYPEALGFIGIQPGYSSQAEQFTYSLGLSFKQFAETGEEDFYQSQLHPENSSLTWKSNHFTLSAGFQTVIWGRMYENSPIDQLAVRDLSRFLVDPLEDRRLSQGLLRAEYFIAPLKIDLVLVPYSMGPKLPHQDSLWHPINKTTGQIISSDMTEAERAVVRTADIVEDEEGGFSGGVRATYTAAGIDFGLTTLRTRLQEPYFRVEVNNGQVLVKEERPYNNIFALDFGSEWLEALWRLEVAHYSDLPVTSTTAKTSQGGRTAASVEFYPGDGDQLINLQVSSQTLLISTDIQDPKSLWQASLFWEAALTPLLRFRLRLISEFDQYSIYANPELAYTGWDSAQIYLSGHIFDGGQESLFGFYRDVDFTMLGLKYHF